MHSAHPSISFPPREDTHTHTHHHDSEPPIHARSRSSAQVFPNSPKRRSVFSGRSRSNTTTTSSTTSSSSRRSPASSMTSTDQAPSFPSHESSYPAGQFPPLRTERQDSITKSLFSRGSRILRRQGSKFNISATLDEVDEGEREKPRFDVTDLFGRHRSRQSDARSDDNLKRLISDPFDFHHLTHTSPSHVQALQRARENELVTEFSAIRASQKPINSLKGIRAEDLQFRNFSSEDLAPGVATSGDDEHAFAAPTNPPASPPASPGAASSVSPKAKPAQRESRVYENFSRPVSRYPRQGSTSSITSPPRRPSRQSSASPDLIEPETRAIDNVLGMNATQQDYHELVYPRKESLSQMNLAGLFESDDESRPRAGSVGTDARISSTNLALDLEDVPEEEEAATHWHESPEQAEKSDSRRLSPAPADMGPSSSNLSVPKSHPSICVAEELSRKFSEALASPTLPQHRLYQQQQQQQQQPEQKAQRKSQQARGSVSKRESVIDINIDSWDADIDYCYEHAAESTSDFDWTRRSFDEPQHPVIEEDPNEEEEQSSKPQSTHLSTSSLPCPDLDPSPSRSVPSTQFAVTPSTTTYEGDYFQQVPASFFPPTEGKNMTQDTLYDEFNADAASDRHFSFCSQGVIKAPMDHQVSPRSSFSPISNCNSQESLILSRAASIVRKHRSSVSTTSVPELIPSLASSRENMPAESPSVPSLPDAYHRQTKSLETNQALFGSTASLDSADISPGTVSHDRAKSTSDLVETALPKGDVVPSLPQTGTVKNAGRKKSRTSSYSLFPTS
ncbi:hypothetical protein SI65_01123 [Aspergillus cristatus]|uniref:CRIB domain-containing protein n=1 Tax=Aspergillus cristatus TaxID=573508 RepID=A0A1E3BRC3_ASPCR|nr:hypothetical protein SI65_01123 [Aspergillus cristatus]